MKSKNFLSNLWSRVAGSQRNDVEFDRRLTVGSPSGFTINWTLKLVSVLVLVLTIGIGNVWGAKETVTISTIASANSWTNGTHYSGWTSSSGKFTFTAANSGQGLYYTSDNSWRGYKSKGSMVITAGSGITISSVTSSATASWSVASGGGSASFTPTATIKFTSFTIIYTEAASCGVPTAPTNGSVTASSQPVSWTAPSSAPANGYVVALCATNTVPNTSVTITNGAAYWSGDYYFAHIAAGTKNYTFSTASGAYLTAGTTYYWWVRSKCGASDYSAWVAGTAFTIPNIEVSETAIDGLDYDVSAGGPSTAKTFTVSGTGLTGNLTVALDEGASSKFEISKTSASSGYGNSLTLTQSSGTVSSTTIWVRLKSGHSAGDYLEEITISGGTATSQTVAIEGVVCSKLAAPTGLTLSKDHGGTAGRTRFGWNSVSGATGYKVTVTKGGNSATATTAADRYYYITTFSDGDYTWTVQALGDGSTYCEEGTAADGTPFSYCHKDVSGVTPTVNAATSIGKYGATANWSAVTDADHYTVKVYRGSNASGTLEKTYSDVTGTSQVITGLSSANTTYYIEVQAHDACGHDSSKGGVTFTTLNLTLYTVTFVNAAGEAPAAVTQVSEGGTVSIPSVTACDGWEFVGWKIGSAQSSVTSDPTGSGYIKNATYPFNYTPGSNITAYAVFKKTEGGGGDTEVLAKSIGFESSEGFTASTTYNNESTPNTQGPTGEKWDFIMGTPSSNDALKNSQSAQMRSYSGKYTAGYVMMTYNISRVTKVKFLAKNNGTGALHCYYSTNSGSTWTGDQNMNINNTATYYTYIVSATGEYANVRIKFQNETTNAAGRVYIDSVYIYHMEAGGGTTTWKSDVSCTCPNYSFHSKNSSSVWDDPICFAQVGSSTLYRTEEIELPTDGVSFKVGWHDADDVANAKTNEKDWQYMVAGPTTTRLGGGYWTVGGHLTSGNTGGAKGYFYVYSDSNEDNKYVGFTPSGYVLRWGKSESWTSKAFTAASASIDETEWNTEAVTLSSSNASAHIYVGLKTESGYVWCNNSEEQRVIFLSPGVWDSDGCKFGLWDKTHLTWRGFMQDADGDGVYEGTVPSTCTQVTFARFDGAKTEPVWDQQYNKSADQTISSLTDKNMFSVTGWGSTYCEGNWNTVYNKPGVFRINAGSNLKNWSCKFVPHFVLTYDKNNNDATGTMSPTTVASDAVSKNVSVAACGFTAPTGYHFDHWDTAPDGSGSDYAPNATYNLTADVTLYAIWAVNTHTLTWAYDGGTPSGSYTTAGTVAYGTALTAPTVTKTGYTFNAWSPNVPSTMGDADATYTATWTANTYSVRFNRNGGTGGADMANQNFTYGVAQNLSTCTFTKAGKSFGGWATSQVLADAGTVAYTAGQSVSNLSSTQGATIDLYAVWVDCTLYTVTLNVNGSAWKTVTQGSCGASISMSGYTDVPNCGGGYTLRGWSTTNTAAPMFDAPTITTSSTYTPTADITLYAVFSHSAVIGERVTSTASISGYEYYYVVAAGYDKVMAQPTSTTNLAAAIDVAKSADGSKCVVTGSGTPLEIMFTDKSTYWMISKYNSSTGNYWYYYSQSSRNALAWYDEDDYQEWWIEDYIEKYGDWYDAEAYVATNTTSSKWSISIDGSGVATISESTYSRTWKYNSGDGKFGAYTSGNKAVSLYQLNESGVIYTTQPDMTYYTITKGVESGGTFNIAEGVACSGHAVDVTATPSSGYVFSGWTSSSGGSFGNASSATTTFTPTANTTVTANFVAAAPHDITWMVNGVALSSGSQATSLTAGTSFSTMTLPTAPANNTLSSACGAVANQFIGWSQTDMGFATGQSAPAKYFTNAAGAGSAYGLMGDADVTFYAVFAQDGSSNYMSRCPHTYTITLDDNGSYGGDGSAMATEMSTTLTNIVAPTRLGYSVEGYYLEPGCSNKVSTPAGALQASKTGWTNGSSQFIGTSDGTLYANWSINTYNLTYENLNGASNSNPTTYQVTTATITLQDPGSREGYTFTGWTCGGSPITTIPLGSTGDKTITANWSAQVYAITYKDKDDVAYSGDKTDGRPTGNPANHTYGSATALVDGVRVGYRFDGWFTTSACTGEPITSIGATAYTSAITLYAKWTASYTFTFSKNGVVDGTLTRGQVEGGNLVMPNTTVDCGLWTTFEGWVEADVAETTIEPTMYRAGDIYVVPTSCGDKQFKAVYSKHEGDATVSYVKETSGPRSGTYVIAGDNSHMYIFAGFNAENSTTTYGKYATDHTFSGSDANVITNKGGGVEVSIIKSTNGKFAIKSGSYCAKPSSADLNTKETDPAAALVWQMSESRIQEVDATTFYLEINNSNHQFKCYAGTQTKAYLYRKKVAGTTYYTTAPASCSVPTEITVSYNDNKAHAGDQTISGMPSGTTLTFTSYPNFASYTVGSAPTDPTGYHFAGWNTSADGSGSDYAAGASVTTFGYVEAITLFAKWERVYSVTLYDNGVERTTLVEASAGAGVTLPSGNNCTPSSEFTFVGWTESAIQLNAEPVRPAAATLHAAGSYSPTDDITLYSVYSCSVAGCDDFAAQGSGSYKMYDNTSSDYAKVTANSNRYDKGSSGDAEIFYIAYAPAHSAYTIRTSLGYLGWSGSAGSENLTKTNTTPYYWNITTNGTNWNFQPVGVSGKQFSGNGTYFNLHSNSTKNYIRLEKIAMTYYYSTALCGDATITFHAGGGTISGTPTTPDGSSWNSSTHVLSGLKDCDKITTFPTAEYEGWTFAGWSTDNYSSSGHSTSGYEEENGSTDEPDASSVFRTDGNPFIVRGGSIDLYPIFTRMPSSEPFNMETGGDYVIYYIDESADDGYGGHPVKFAGPFDGTKRYTAVTNCANATVFTFTKDGDVWHIQNKSNSKYIGGKTADDWLVENASLGTLTDWTITIRNGNQLNASCQSGRQIGVHETYFMDYTTNDINNNPGYHCIYLGSCEERIYSSEPSPAPTLDLDGTPSVTSSLGQTIRTTETFRLSGAHLGDATKVTLSGTNLTFATSATAAPVADLEVSVTSGNVGPVNVYVYYTPIATEDGIENITVTATANNTATTTKRATVTARHLPANFVIAAKASNGKWYALPADITGSTSPTNGVLIEVDNNEDPTTATSAPNNVQWGLRNVKATRQTTNGLGHHLTFTERLSTATADNQKTLYNGSTTSIQAYAMWSGYATTNPEQYEWIPTTTDLKDYTLTSAKTFDGDAAARTLSMNTSGVFGSLLQAKAYDGKVRLLPAEFYTNAAAQVVEWKASSVVVMYTGTQTTAKTKVGANSASSAQTLSEQMLTHAIYELTTGQSLASNDGKKLEITFGTTEKLIVEIPVIITGTSTASDNHASQDLIILKNAKLTAATTKYSYRNVYVYGGGKLDIPDDKSLGVNNIILRAGGISTNGSGGSATYEYIYPQVKLVGELTSSVPNIKYEYVTDYTHWYHLCLPFDASYTSVSYPQEYYGSNVAADNHGSWVIKRYDGAKRATGDYDAWVDIETDWKKEGDPKTVYAGHGYIFWGAPKKVSVDGGAATRQAWGIQRMTMAIAAGDAKTAENANKTVTDLAAHSSETGGVNDQGWNLIGNPYMVNLTGLESTSLKQGQLVKEMVDNRWTGKWIAGNASDTRYITVPDDNFETYEAQPTSYFDGSTLEKSLIAGRTFFVQLADEATAVEFDVSKRASLAPAWHRNTEAEQPVDVETGIVMSSETLADEVNFWIKDGKTEAYEFNADYPKTPNKTNFNIYGVHQSGNLSWVAISPAIAEGDMAIGYQVPAAGDYTLSLSEKYIAEDIESVFVTDHGVSPELTTDLMVNTYTFTVHQAETNNERFTVSIKVREKDNTPTDIGNSTVETHAVKFIRDDKMYILRNGLLYDATGKRVTEINK